MTSSRDESTEKEPVMCSKCNEIFETDSKYIQHYNEKHKAEEKEQAQKQRESTICIVHEMAIERPGIILDSYVKTENIKANISLV